MFSENLITTQRQKLTELIFEEFTPLGIYFMKQEVLSLIGCGKYNGFVLNVGESATTAVPIIDGVQIKNCAMKSKFGGKENTNYLIKLLNEKGFVLNKSSNREIIREMKEKICFVSGNYEDDLKKSLNGDNVKEYELPDNNKIKINEEMFKCTEILFKPKLFELDSPSIVDVCFNSIEKCEKEMQKIFYSNKKLLFIFGWGFDYV
jgi:actin-related protein